MDRPDPAASGYDAAVARLEEHDHRTPAAILRDLTTGVDALTGYRPLPIARARQLAANVARDALAALTLTGCDWTDLDAAVDAVHGSGGGISLADHADRAADANWWVLGHGYTHPADYDESEFIARDGAYIRHGVRPVHLLHLPDDQPDDDPHPADEHFDYFTRPDTDQHLGRAVGAAWDELGHYRTGH